ncbi:hypothetical protein FJY63_12865 [Candidatus Sumerlaeota bacterium]|nr:hypothetical protein [Candidatus Sumerlaeota bacterium]
MSQSYLDFAGSVSDERLTRYVVEVMGALRSRRFLPWLCRKHTGDSRLPVRDDIIVAASNFADGESAEFILQSLAAAIRKGTRRGIIPEGSERRAVANALFALGRVVRSPRMDAGGRNEILRRAITLLPESDLRLKYELAYQCFCTSAEGWDVKHLEWAATILTQGLWLADMTPDFAPGDERQTTIIGTRAPTVQALVAIGRSALPAILQACTDSNLRYGVGYVALAEMLGQIVDPRAHDLLERLLANALLHEGSGRTKYQVEKYYDAAEGVRKELAPDQVVGAILFAIERIGGPQADLILVRAYNLIRTPGAASPGTETDAVLERARARLTREGSWNELVRQASERRLETASVQDEPAQRQQAAKALKVLQTRFFPFGGRRERKIAAIQALAGQLNLQAIPLIIAHLEESDAMVRAAAETALGEYALQAGNETIMRALTYALLDGLGSRNASVREAVRGALKRMGPGREPLKSKLISLSRDATDAIVRTEAAQVLREATRTDALESPEATSPDMEEETGEISQSGRADSGASPAKSDKATELQLKREYILARQAWIRGGKRGEPPKPPPGLPG